MFGKWKKIKFITGKKKEQREIGDWIREEIKGENKWEKLWILFNWNRGY